MFYKFTQFFGLVSWLQFGCSAQNTYPLSFLIWPLLPLKCRRGQLLLHLITFNDTHTRARAHTHTHTHAHPNTHPVQFLWTRDPPVTETSTRVTQHLQQTDIHASGGIRTRDPSKWEAYTHALDRAATGTGHRLEICEIWYCYISVQEDSRLLHVTPSTSVTA